MNTLLNSELRNEIQKQIIPGERYSYFIHDTNGIFLEWLNPKSGPSFYIVEGLEKNPDLGQWFDLSALKSAPSLAVFPPRPNQSRLLPVLHLMSTLPVMSLTSRRFGEVYLGRFSLFELAPVTLASLSAQFLLVDFEHDTLIGMDPQFQKMFQERFPSGWEMLGRPLSEFINPTPGQYQASKLSPAPDLKEWSTVSPVLAVNFRDDSWSRGMQIPFKQELKADDQGLLWEFPAGKDAVHESHYLSFARSVDTRTQDFCLTLRFVSRAGLGPSVILGEGYKNEYKLPDQAGYLLGRNANSSHWIMKRGGYTIALKSAGPYPAGASHVLQAVKQGNALFLFYDDECVCACFDPNFLHNPETALSLALRPGYAVVLDTAELRFRKAPPPGKESGLLVRTKAKSSRDFILERYHHPSFMQPGFYHVASFLLYDISMLQNKIRLLNEKVRTELSERETLRRKLSEYEPAGEHFSGRSPAIAKLRETARIVARFDATLLIEGPTGAGKEVLARYVHAQSPRKDGPFMKVDCATIPASLIESHLFGHEKGAFTGASGLTIGMLEAAQGGTLFLDEAGNLPLPIQAKLLQFLNDFTIRRLGGTESKKLNLRVIVASNIPLSQLVTGGLFRSDLYYRVNAVRLVLPPLSERKEDILELAEQFLKQASQEQGKSVEGFSPEALRKLTGHPWPGNVRELKNVIARAVLFCPGGVIEDSNLEFSEDPVLKSRSPRRRPPDYHLVKTDPGHVANLLAKHHGRVVLVAQELGLSRNALYQFFAKHGLRPEDYRKGFASET